jgi:hypothetical protein
VFLKLCRVLQTLGKACDSNNVEAIAKKVILSGMARDVIFQDTLLCYVRNCDMYLVFLKVDMLCLFPVTSDAEVVSEPVS